MFELPKNIVCFKLADGYWGNGFTPFFLISGDRITKQDTLVRIILSKVETLDKWSIHVSGRIDVHHGFNYATNEGPLAWIEAFTVYSKLISQSSVNQQMLLNLGFTEYPF